MTTELVNFPVKSPCWTSGARLRKVLFPCRIPSLQTVAIDELFGTRANDGLVDQKRFRGMFHCLVACFDQCHGLIGIFDP